MLCMKTKRIFLVTNALMLLIFSSCLRTNPPTESFDISTVTFDKNTWPVIIVGGGIGGLTAALYCSQAHIPCLLIEGPKPGGALTQSHSVRNWPGVVQAPGIEIIEDMQDQVDAAGVPMVSGSVTECDFSSWPRVIQVQDVQNPAVKITYKALSLILATGAEPSMLGVPGESGSDGYWGRGVSSCAVCEGALYQNKTVAVVGGGDSSVAEADYLSNIAAKVIMLVRSEAMKAKDIKASKRLTSKNNVQVLFNTTVEEIVGDGNKVTGVVVQDSKKQETHKISVDGVFLAIGSKPNTKIFKDQILLDERGFVVLKKDQETSVKGVFAAGDMCDAVFMQGVTAAGAGCRSALQARDFLAAAGYSPESIVLAIEPTSEEQKEPAQPKKQDKQIGHTIPEIFSEKDFEKQVLKGSKPVVLDVFSTWCIPCQKMMPIVQGLATDFATQVTFVKLNAANKVFSIEKALMRVKGSAVQSVPTFILIKNGVEVARLQGEVDRDTFKNKIKEAFGLKKSKR